MRKGGIDDIWMKSMPTSSTPQMDRRSHAALLHTLRNVSYKISIGRLLFDDVQGFAVFSYFKKIEVSRLMPATFILNEDRIICG